MLAMFFLRIGFQLWQPISHMFMHRVGYAHLFNMFVLYSFGSALERGKVFYSSIFCGLGAALMHTGINYYYFNDAINTLAANGFSSSSALNQGK
jgi:membrane associated rhomboid family serine protease